MRQWMRVCMVVVALAFVVGNSAACTRIGGGYVGIKVNMGGDAKGVEETAATTGWFFYNPFTSDVYEYPTFVQSVVLTQDIRDESPTDESITFPVEKMAINADIGYSFSIKAEKIPAFWVKFRTDDIQLFSHGFMKALIRDEFNRVAGRYSIDEIMGDNSKFLAEVKGNVQKILEPFGVVMEDQFGFIGVLRPPAAVMTSINMKVQATQLAEQKQNELAQATADAAKNVATMQGWATATQLQSEAQAKANLTIARSLTPELIQVKLIDKWDGKYPLSVGGTAAVPLLTIK